MGCYKCEHYDRGLRRCKLGKINPKTVKQAISAIKTMGSLSYVCNEDGMRDKALARMTKLTLNRR